MFSKRSTVYSSPESLRTNLQMINVVRVPLLFWENRIQFWEADRPKMRLNQHFLRLLKWHGILITIPKTTLMVTLQNFRVMPFEKKCDVITFYGNYLAQRTLADCKVFLYFTEGFFVEVFYSPKYQKVLMINAFEKAVGLDPYLDKISLADLLAI